MRDCHIVPGTLKRAVQSIETNLIRKLLCIGEADLRVSELWQCGICRAESRTT